MELKKAGATSVVEAANEASMAVGASLLTLLGAKDSQLTFLSRAMRSQMDARC